MSVFELTSVRSISSAWATGLSIWESNQRASRARPESEVGKWVSDKLRVNALKLAVQPERSKVRVGILAAVGASVCVICAGTNTLAWASGAGTT